MAQSSNGFRLTTKMGDELGDPELRRMIVAATHAMGERMGLPVLEVQVEPDSLHVVVDGPPFVAQAFGLELRRGTNKWYMARCGRSLWRDGT